MNYYAKYKKYKNKYNKLKLNIQTGGNQDSIWVKEDFLKKKDFDLILDYCSQLKLKKDSRSNNRLTLCLNPNSHKELYDLIYQNENFINFIKKIKDDDHYIKFNPSYPIEYRKYFTGSEGMDWHIDTSLFEPDCFEIVLTLTNTSDSKFEYTDNGKNISLLTKPNTLVIVRPQSILHRVTPINKGERTILKFIIEFIKEGNNDNIKKGNFSNEINNCPF